MPFLLDVEGDPLDSENSDNLLLEYDAIGQLQMPILAAKLNLVTDQHAVFARAWPLTYQSTGDPVLGLDVDTAELRTRGDRYVIPVDFDSGTATFSFAHPASEMTDDGPFLYDVKIVPSTGEDDAWFLFYGQLLVRDRTDA